jgi:hypothetical protein
VSARRATKAATQSACCDANEGEDRSPSEIKPECAGCKRRAITACKSWCYKPLSFQKVPPEQIVIPQFGWRSGADWNDRKLRAPAFPFGGPSDHAASPSRPTRRPVSWRCRCGRARAAWRLRVEAVAPKNYRPARAGRSIINALTQRGEKVPIRTRSVRPPARAATGRLR